MNTTEIQNRVKQQLLSINSSFEFDKGDKDTLDFYTELIEKLNALSEVSGFQIGINTGTSEFPLSNFTIITFDDDELTRINIKPITKAIKSFEPDEIRIHPGHETTLIEFPY